MHSVNKNVQFSLFFAFFSLSEAKIKKNSSKTENIFGFTRTFSSQVPTHGFGWWTPSSPIEPLRCGFVLGVVLSEWRCVLVVFGCVCIVGACVGLGRISMFGESEVSCVCGVYPAWTMRLSM